MLISSRDRRSDKDLYNYYSENFIPIACHYNEDTILTKNGELVQTIEVNGINADDLSDELFNLRAMVRSAIEKNVSDNHVAFWIHTIRRKTNLDDSTPYVKTFSAGIHDLWRRKNYWHDKYVNTLYVSVVYKSSDMNLASDPNHIITALSPSKVASFHDKYFEESLIALEKVSNGILTDLGEYGARKIGIRFDGEETYSDSLFLYRRIIHLNETQIPLPIADFSHALATHQYAVGGDKIEVISADEKKFASIISVKEYQEISAEALDRFLQIPVELIATEIFYFIDKNEVDPIFSYQDYILKVSGDADLRDATGISAIMKKDDYSPTKFCNQQISITIIGDDVASLDAQMKHASEELSEIGLVHVREDINLEQVFWSQLPGNFSFLRRLVPNTIKNTAALASLHNFPTGLKYNPWGNAITLLRTERGTPYFMNLHTESSGGFTCIYGSKKSGKTVLTNFLISESTKFDPAILYLTNSDNSKIFIEGIEGIWADQTRNIFNPFLIQNPEESKDFLCEFIKILSNHYPEPLSEDSIAFISYFVDQALAIEEENRNLSSALKKVDFSKAGGEEIKKRLSPFDENSRYNGLFDSSSPFVFPKGGVLGAQLREFTDSFFTDNFYPSDKKLLAQFIDDAKYQSSMRSAILYGYIWMFLSDPHERKIVAMDNIHEIINAEYFSWMISLVSDYLKKQNSLFLASIDLDTMQNDMKTGFWNPCIDLVDTQIVLPSNVGIDNLDKFLSLTNVEESKLNNIPLSAHAFLIKQAGHSIIAELSIGGLPGILRMLSSDADDLKIFETIKSQNPGHPDNWIGELYNAFDRQG